MIRKFEETDWPQVWALIKPVFRAGQSYAVPPDITEGQAYEYWINTPEKTYVIKPEGQDILGSYYLIPNPQAAGERVCNCGYIVAKASRGQGLASLMCQHSQKMALEQGFRSMQFNFVVSTNTGAVQLWERLGFNIIATREKAFSHPQAGLVDAFVMYKDLSA